MKLHPRALRSILPFTLLLAAACSSSSGGNTSNTGGPQTPAQGEANVKAWLATGDYKSWHCEPMEHAARSPSPHGFNRICSNDVLAATATGNFPQGAAAVKELWTAVGGTVMGYAVYLKTAADSAGGANWYYYEDNPSLNPPGGVVADGLGSEGNPKSICVACHSLAGSDTMHTGRGDFVYTQVQ